MILIMYSKLIYDHLFCFHKFTRTYRYLSTAHVTSDVFSIFSIVSFRKANKLGIIFKVTPLVQDGDVKVFNCYTILLF